MEKRIIKLTTNRTIYLGELTEEFSKQYLLKSLEVYSFGFRFVVVSEVVGWVELRAFCFTAMTEYERKIISCYYENHSLDEVAAKVGKTKENIRIFLKRRGIDTSKSNRVTIKRFRPKNNGLTSIERFWQLVDKSGDCWLWQGRLHDAGYGYFCFGKELYAHRIAYYFHFKSRPKQHVLHSCDNPPCVNPSHLRDGSPQENAIDRETRNRSLWKTNPAQMKTAVLVHKKKYQLFITQGKTIVKRFLNGESARNLAKEFGLNQTTVRRWVKRLKQELVTEKALLGVGSLFIGVSQLNKPN